MLYGISHLKLVVKQEEYFDELLAPLRPLCESGKLADSQYFKPVKFS